MKLETVLTRKIGTKRRAGFTLLELLVVIFIISLFSAVVFPSFFGHGADNLKYDARKTASLLRYLNDNAIATKETYPLKFDLQEGTLLWKGPEGEKTEKIKSLSSLYLQSKGEIKEGQITVFFGPLGIQENIEVHLKDNEKVLSVSLNPLSGRVKIISKEEG